MNRESRGVSPVIAVILMVAVTVVLSAAIGAFVFDLGQSSTSNSQQQSLGVSMSQTSTGLEITVITGDADEIQVLVNGEPAQTINAPQTGDSVSVTGVKGDDVSIVSKSDGKKRVTATTTIEITPSFQRGIVAHYPFEAGDGTKAYDIVGDNEGNLNGTTWTTDSAFGGSSMYFDGNDYVDLPEKDLTNITSEFTYATWVKIPSHGTRTNFFQIRESSGGGVMTFKVDVEDTGELRFQDVDNMYLSGTIPTGEYVHIAVVADGTNVTGYINGTKYTLKGSAWNPGTPSTTRMSSEGGEKTLDDTRIYDRGLSETEIQNLYSATK